MSACLGWLGPCSEHGQFHGCRFDDSHRGDHYCRCGSVQKNGGRQIKNPYHALTAVERKTSADAVLQQ